jgi:hypothetical protein
MKKDKLRKKIKKDIADFLASGGTIKQIPRGHQTEMKVINIDRKNAINAQKKLHDILFTDNKKNDSNNT